MSTTESPKETAFQKVAACLDEQGSFLTKADIEGRFTCSYSQMVAYVSTELFRLVMCEERLIPTENKDLDKEIKSLIKMLRTRLYNIAKQMDFIPLDESLDPTMFCFPGGFIAPQALELWGNFRKPTKKDTEHGSLGKEIRVIDVISVIRWFYVCVRVK